MEARIRLAAARRELADAVNDATTGIGCLTCDAWRHREEERQDHV